MNELASTYIVSGVAIEKDGKYLLVQEKQPKAFGKWNLPAGKVDKGESLQEAAIREAKEECGFDVELGEPMKVLHATTESPVLHAFKAKIIGGELNFPEDEILDAKWFTVDEILSMKEQLRNQAYILGALNLTQ